MAKSDALIWFCKTHRRQATHRDEKGNFVCEPGQAGILMPCDVIPIPAQPKPGEVELSVARALCGLMQVGGAALELKQSINPQPLATLAAELRGALDLRGKMLQNLLHGLQKCVRAESEVMLGPLDSYNTHLFMVQFCPCSKHTQIREALLRSESSQDGG